MSERFYVYALRDPRDDAIFYIGKGMNLRAWEHEKDVRAGRVSNAAKTAKIREIIAAGHCVFVQIVARYEEESDAFDHEEELIATLPGLTNILAGGGGVGL